MANEKLSHERLWKAFATRESLSDGQIDQFKKYAALLMEHSANYNLTAITAIPAIISFHFSDSLALGHEMEMSGVQTIMDVGSGAGFPGIPLKIVYPHLRVVLMEVNRKKQQFLKLVCKELGIDDVEICDLDYRTFLRTTEGEIDLFLARASVNPVELCRLFKPSCSYHAAKLVYWATSNWAPDAKIASFISKEVPYKIKHKERKLVFFKAM